MTTLSHQYGFYIDSEKCTGCKTCMIACKDYKNLPTAVNFRRVYEYTGGNWSANGPTWNADIFAYYLSIACNHCADPACTKVCPSGAMAKDQNGFVAVDDHTCIGCKSCHMACPYGAPQFNAEIGRMTKCDGCRERVAEGLKPVCVESCPLRALDLLPIGELREKYGILTEVAPMPPSHFTKPNIAIMPNRKARPQGDKTGFLANPMEV